MPALANAAVSITLPSKAGASSPCSIHGNPASFCLFCIACFCQSNVVLLLQLLSKGFFSQTLCKLLASNSVVLDFMYVCLTFKIQGKGRAEFSQHAGLLAWLAKALAGGHCTETLKVQISPVVSLFTVKTIFKKETFNLQESPHSYLWVLMCWMRP